MSGFSCSIHLPHHRRTMVMVDTDKDEKFKWMTLGKDIVQIAVAGIIVSFRQHCLTQREVTNLAK